MKKALLFLLCITLALGMCSCGGSITAEELLSRLLAVSGEDTEGNGSIFYGGAFEGELGYFSKAQAESIYGENAVEKYFEKIEDMALFLSSRMPGEIGVFKCYAASDTDDIVQMCLLRADAVKVALRDSEYADKADTIEIKVHQKYVVFIFAEEPKKVGKRLLELV